MSKGLMKLGKNPVDALEKLRCALEARFTKLNASGPSYLANDVMYSLTHSDDMESIGDASMDLEEIIAHLPSITSEDRDNAASILSNITFTQIPPSFKQKLAQK